MHRRPLTLPRAPMPSLWRRKQRRQPPTHPHHQCHTKPAITTDATSIKTIMIITIIIQIIITPPPHHHKDHHNPHQNNDDDDHHHQHHEQQRPGASMTPCSRSWDDRGFRDA
uniref:Uncharacterized protein n=1 Tax=Octopus bimaculoides TaxID=37653 RepID=A0A0L8HN43_OCTBM